jgi:hypothetical protein
LLVVDLYGPGVPRHDRDLPAHGPGQGPRRCALRIVPSPTREVMPMLDLTGIGSLIQIATEAEAAAA